MKVLSWFFGLFSVSRKPQNCGSDADYADSDSVWCYQVRDLRTGEVLADGYDCDRGAYEASQGFEDRDTEVVKVVDGVLVCF